MSILVPIWISLLVSLQRSNSQSAIEDTSRNVCVILCLLLGFIEMGEYESKLENSYKYRVRILVLFSLIIFESMIMYRSIWV